VANWIPIPGFVGDSYQARSLKADAQRAVNLYLSSLESSQAKNVAVLQGTPGTRVFGVLPTAPVRCLWAGDGRLFAVGGSTVYEINPDGTIKTNFGAIPDGGATTPVKLFANGFVLFGVSGNCAFYVNGAPANNITIPQYGLNGNGIGPVTASYGAYCDGYFIAENPDSNQVNISPPLDNTGMWDALQYFSKTGAPDRLEATIHDHEEVYLMGYETIEVWQDTGQGLNGFAFQKDPGATMQIGIGARWSAASLDDGVVWLNQDVRGRGVAYFAQGYQPQRISTRAIEKAWGTYPTITDAEAFTYKEEGHEFWHLSFPSGNATWVYDRTESLLRGRPIWHERVSGGVTGRQRQHCHAFAFEQHLVGDYQSGKIYVQSLDITNDAGTPITRQRTCPHLGNMGMRMFGHALRTEMDDSLATAITLEISRDGGKTYGNPRTGRMANTDDGYLTAVWDRLGAWRNGNFRWTCSDDTQMTLINAYLLATQGTR
jgi:hypothetical protein